MPQYQRNSNGDHAIDPISLNKIPIERAIRLSSKYYNINTLRQWINSRTHAVLPHTGMPLTINDKKRVVNFNTDPYRDFCVNERQPRTKAEVLEDKKILDSVPPSAWPSSTRSPPGYYCYVKDARGQYVLDPIKRAPIPKVRALVLDSQHYDVASLYQSMSKDKTPTGSETTLPHTSRLMVTRHYESIVKQMSSRLKRIEPMWSMKFSKWLLEKLTWLDSKTEGIDVKYKRRMVLRQLSLVYMKHLIDFENDHVLAYVVDPSHVHELYDLKRIAQDVSFRRRRA